MSDKTEDFSPAQSLLQELISANAISNDDWLTVPVADRERINQIKQLNTLVGELVSLKLLTPYQGSLIENGRLRDLAIGNYKVLDVIGSGGMGVVYRAQHLFLKWHAAIKVIHSESMSYENLQRFFNEVWVVAQLSHPNIVRALDAGRTFHESSHHIQANYLVMEFVEGRDLDNLVRGDGPLPVPLACDLAYQIASALAEADRHHLIHRDIKPSNIRVTAKGQAKLLDFGLALNFRSCLTEPGTVVGTIDFLAPEQAANSHNVDIRADIYSLGATLYWALTGATPFPQGETLVEKIFRRQTETAPGIQSVRPDLPSSLQDVVAQMMAVNPDERYASPKLVMQALLPYLPKGKLIPELPGESIFSDYEPNSSDAPTLIANASNRVLVVDDEKPIRNLCRIMMEQENFYCDEAADGPTALKMLETAPYDLVLLDIAMPEMPGTEVLRRIRENPPCSHLKVIMLSGHVPGDELAPMLLAGADDFLTKPFRSAELKSRTKAAMKMKEIQQRLDRFNGKLIAANHELELNLHTKNIDLVHARNALVLAMADLVAYRDSETGAHLLRLQRYCRRIAEEAARMPAFEAQIDQNFIQALEGSAPLHDIGKVGLPDYILLKPGKLTAEERIIMQAHTTIGASILQKVAQQHQFAVAFLQMAADIARHHHERFDGTGYPDHLVGSAIPLAARILALADVYDAMRSRRPYKPALPHGAAIDVMKESAEGHFDPALWQVFLKCAKDLDYIFRDSREA